MTWDELIKVMEMLRSVRILLKAPGQKLTTLYLPTMEACHLMLERILDKGQNRVTACYNTSSGNSFK